MNGKKCVTCGYQLAGENYDLLLDSEGECFLCEKTNAASSTASADVIKAICFVGNSIREEIAELADLVGDTAARVDDSKRR